MSQQTIEILYFDGCPNVESAMAQIRSALGEGCETDKIVLTPVANDAAALRLRFLGSPTVRVDGCDVEPGAGLREEFGLQCRVYEVGGRFQGFPPVEWIQAALDREQPSASPNPPHAAPRQCDCGNGPALRS